jgi:hypothetical protein
MGRAGSAGLVRCIGGGAARALCGASPPSTSWCFCSRPPGGPPSARRPERWSAPCGHGNRAGCGAAFDVLALSLVGAAFTLKVVTALLVPHRPPSAEKVPVAVRVLQVSRPSSVEGLGPEGPAPRAPPTGRSWLTLSVETSLPGQPMGLSIPLALSGIVATDGNGLRHPLAGIALPPEQGSPTQFLFIQEALGNGESRGTCSCSLRSQGARKPCR